MIPTALGVALTSVTAPSAPSGDSALYAWALTVVCGALAAVATAAWRTARADLATSRGETAAARAELKEANAQQLALAKTMMSEVVPAMTRTTDVTARATEALLERGRRG